MEKIDLTYLTQLGEDASTQLRQLIQNKGTRIVKAINEKLADAGDDESVIFSLSHMMKIDLTDMQLEGKLSFNRKESTSLVTAIEDPEQPQFDLGDGKRGNMGAAGEGDSGATEESLVPAGEEPRKIEFVQAGKPELACSRCGEIFMDEGEGQEHLDGPECEEAVVF